jgi:pilus assembly protein CpaB
VGRRTLLLVAALVVAALGTTMVFLYAQNKQNVTVAATNPMRVLVATTNIAAGTTGATAVATGAFEAREVPATAVVPNALGDASAVTDLVATTTIYAGQQIIPQQWGTGGASSSLPIPAGKMAMSIQLGDPQRVAGFVVPGSSVVVFATLPDPLGGKQSTKVLLPSVPVIAVGPTTVVAKTTASTSDSSTNTEQIPTAILTLGLSQREAEKLAYATQTGQLYLGLLGKDAKVVPDAGVDATTVNR